MKQKDWFIIGLVVFVALVAIVVSVWWNTATLPGKTKATDFGVVKTTKCTCECPYNSAKLCPVPYLAGKDCPEIYNFPGVTTQADCTAINGAQCSGYLASNNVIKTSQYANCTFQQTTTTPPKSPSPPSGSLY